MSELKKRLTDDLATALKAGDESAKTVLRGLLSAVKNAEIEQGGELDEAAVTAVLAKQLKQREESAAAYESRPELAEAEKGEAAVIAKYLPEQMSDDELAGLVEAAVTETGASAISDMGKVMGALKPKLAGRADAGRVAAQVKARLG